MAFEVLYMQTGETPARLDRWWIDRIFSEGVSDVQAGDLLVSQRAGAANLSVDVAAGDAVIDGDDITDQGAYLARSTSVVNLELAAPPAAGARIDLVVLRVLDSTTSGEGTAATDGVVLEVVEGVADAAPVAPAVPGTAIALAEVRVAAGDVAVLDAAITDRRAQLNATTLDVGTQAIPLTTAERDALNDPGVGTLVHNTDTGSLDQYDGAAWTPIGMPPRVDRFTVSGTWTKAEGAKSVTAIIVAGGDGAAAGNLDGNGYGGAGGKGGNAIAVSIPADLLAATEAVTVGAGGAGGLPDVSSSFDVHPGQAGGSSSFADVSTAKVQGQDYLGGDAGDGGTSGSSTPGEDGFTPLYGGGGGGGGASNADGAESVGGAGGPGGIYGQHGGPGGASASGPGAPGIAPGGGGGGGGGGGTSYGATASGAGGDGARGEVIAITYF